jgi:hypothetical protein
MAAESDVTVVFPRFLEGQPLAVFFDLQSQVCVLVVQRLTLLLQSLQPVAHLRHLMPPLFGADRAGHHSEADKHARRFRADRGNLRKAHGAGGRWLETTGDGKIRTAGLT